jgi:hypothetical protein
MSKKDEELAKEGWERKSIADEPRLSELVEMYKSLGLEVRLEPVLTEEEADEEECKECRICFEGQPKDKYMVIYTRKKADSKSDGGLLEELF